MGDLYDEEMDDTTEYMTPPEMQRLLDGLSLHGTGKTEAIEGLLYTLGLRYRTPEEIRSEEPVPWK